MCSSQLWIAVRRCKCGTVQKVCERGQLVGSTNKRARRRRCLRLETERDNGAVMLMRTGFPINADVDIYR